MNRPVVTGLYTHATVIDPGAMRGLFSTTAFSESYNAVAATHGYTNTLFPTTGTILTVTYHDTYQFRTDMAGASYAYTKNHLTGQETAENAMVKGKMTGSKVNVLGTANYLWSANYYDGKYRPLQIKALNHKGGIDRLTNKYSFLYLMETKTTHNNGALSDTVHRKFIYDHGGRLMTLTHKHNNEADVTLAQNTYNELGQLVTKNSHSRSASPFAQTTDYEYNIRGWLIKINDPLNPQAGDLFSQELKYNLPTAQGGVAQYNGNISESIWTSAGADRQSYGYYYDSLNRLKEARYFNQIRSTENGRYNEVIGGMGNKGYDLNGNILKLQRYGRLNTTPIASFSLMDNLAYTYNGNQLTRVDDAIALSATEEGFRENTKVANEYAYTGNGNMSLDQNKGITAIAYNFMNLTQQVNKGATNYIVYTYDATGRKLSQQVFGAAAKTTDYLGEYVYENNALQYILHEEGRIIPGTTSEYQYFLKDHLGNVRMTFSEKKTTTQYSTDLEASTNANFRNYTNRSSFNLFDHSDVGTTKTYSQLLNGGNNSQVGLAKSFAVNPGDMVDLEVYAKYEGATTTGNNVNTLVTALISAFGLTSTGTGPIDGSMAYNAFNSAFSAGPYIGRVPAYEDVAAPRAYLNYILFDENFVLKDFGFDQISTSAMQVGATPVIGHDYLSLHVKVQQKGYLYVYLSNEQTVQTNVYFDDMKITYNTGVELSNSYYPFGLTFNSYSRENSVKQDYQYNGKEKQDELNLGWLDYGARMYQSDLGRFFTQDRFAEKYYSLNPYQYGANNPLLFMDANGDSLIVNGSQSQVNDFVAVSNQGTGGFYNTQVGEDGQVSLEPTQLVGPPSPEQDAFAKLMSGVISDPNNVEVRLTSGTDDTMVGDFYFQTIDMEDVKEFGNGPVVSAQGTLIHEVTEQQAKQSYGMDKGSGPEMAHFLGVLSENQVNGSTRTSVFAPLSTSNYESDRFGVRTGTIDLGYTKNNEAKTVSLIVKDNNIVKVKQ